jgi:zona occludens toxin (predicted ATPase)
MEITSWYIRLMLMDIDDQYNEILQPERFIENFNTMGEFYQWCLTGDIIDLEEALKVFETYELYEHCTIIKQALDEKYFED